MLLDVKMSPRIFAIKRITFPTKEEQKQSIVGTIHKQSIERLPECKARR